MTRSLITVVAMAAALGGAVAWLKHTGGPGPGPAEVHTVLRPAATPDHGGPAAGLASSRREFPLGAADVHADRETPALAVDAEGRVLLAWASQTDESERTIYLARSDDGGASFGPTTPWRRVPIYRYSSGKKRDGQATVYSTHVLPRLAAAGREIVLGWVEAVDGGPEVRYYVARSADGGRNFSEPAAVHGAGARRPGFTTLAAAPDGTVLAAWLDGRNEGQQPFAAARPGGSDGFRPEQLVYAGPPGEKGVCPCCDLAVVRGPDGRDIVAFRNAEGGHRDIWVTRSRPDGRPGFEAPIPVGASPWTFDGCPHDGPALALDGDRLHVLWMDAHTGRGRIYAARSSLASWSFAARSLRPESAGSQGHPRAVVRDGRLYAAWDEAIGDEGTGSAGPSGGGRGHEHGPAPSGEGRAIMLSMSTDAGVSFASARPVAPRAGAYQLHPAIAFATDGAILLAWDELDAGGKRVVVARIEGSGAAILDEGRGER